MNWSKKLNSHKITRTLINVTINKEKECNYVNEFSQVVSPIYFVCFITSLNNLIFHTTNNVTRVNIIYFDWHIYNHRNKVNEEQIILLNLTHEIGEYETFAHTLLIQTEITE